MKAITQQSLPYPLINTHWRLITPHWKGRDSKRFALALGGYNYNNRYEYTFDRFFEAIIFQSEKISRGAPKDEVEPTVSACSAPL